MRIFVAGGTGAVGTGIVRALLGAGHEVVVPSRAETSLEGLRARLDDAEGLVGIIGDLASIDGARAVAEQAGTLDHVVVSLGGWWSGPPARELALGTLDEVLAMGLHAHLVAARVFLPLLDGTEGAVYVLVNGGAARTPVPRSSAVSVSAAAQLMLARALAVEQPDEGARVRSLVLETPIISHTRPEGPDGWLTADEVGGRVEALLGEPGDDVVVPLPDPDADA